MEYGVVIMMCCCAHHEIFAEWTICLSAERKKGIFFWFNFVRSLFDFGRPTTMTSCSGVRFWFKFTRFSHNPQHYASSSSSCNRNGRVTVEEMA